VVSIPDGYIGAHDSKEGIGTYSYAIVTYIWYESLTDNPVNKAIIGDLNTLLDSSESLTVPYENIKSYGSKGNQM